MINLDQHLIPYFLDKTYRDMLLKNSNNLDLVLSVLDVSTWPLNHHVLIKSLTGCWLVINL